ncbi:MAG: hypothetical protein PHI55_02960 [Burkholderiaceae bacterium]|nr:hypothetical protein [Burkholderiaceae bacterium]
MATRYNGSTAADTLNFSSSTTAVELYGLAGNDTLVGGSSADTLVGGRNTDRLTGGAGSDVFAFAAGDSPVSVTYEKSKDAQFAHTISQQDVVTDFQTGLAGDRIAFAGARVAANATGDGVDSVRMWRDGDRIATHSIQNGVIEFADNNLRTPGNLVLISTAMVGAAVDYLAKNDLGSAGTTVVFTSRLTDYSIGTTTDHSYVYVQTGEGAGGNLIDLVGFRATSLASDATGLLLA